MVFRVFERLPGCWYGGLRDAVGSVYLLAVLVVELIEVPDLARDRRLETRGVEPGDRSDPALPREETVPGLLHRRAEGGDEPDARHDDPAAFAALHAVESREACGLERLERGDLRGLDVARAGAQRER